jgi:hypothetical protein
VAHRAITAALVEASVPRDADIIRAHELRLGLRGVKVVQ